MKLTNTSNQNLRWLLLFPVFPFPECLVLTQNLVLVYVVIATARFSSKCEGGGARSMTQIGALLKTKRYKVRGSAFHSCHVTKQKVRASSSPVKGRPLAVFLNNINCQISPGPDRLLFKNIESHGLNTQLFYWEWSVLTKYYDPKTFKNYIFKLSIVSFTAYFLLQHLPLLT